jgi:hypothetical protein
MARKKAKRFSPYVCCAVTVLYRKGGPIMRAAGTYFEQVPKTVIEKILAQQEPPAEDEMDSNAALEKPAVSDVPNRSKSRNPKP